ncbi:MAG TPA: SPOR domain-containing protein, partial [Candidatus Binatia bacterium]|nr:SPOR domain-containing protein [Candidatus Binatia bacterium]
MAENRRGRENRFYFSRGQMVLLGAAFTFASLVIFVLGLFVGKGIEGRKIQQKEEPLVRIPVKPGGQQTSAAPVAPSKDEITFDESSPKAETKAKVKVAEKQEKADTRTENTSKVQTTVAKAAEKKADKSAAAADSAKKIVTAEAVDLKDQDRTWRAQVNAYPDERSAKQIVDRLKNKGYKPYVTEVENRGKIWFRVSVGKYATREEAERAVEVLRAKENFP